MTGKWKAAREAAEAATEELIALASEAAENETEKQARMRKCFVGLCERLMQVYNRDKQRFCSYLHCHANDVEEDYPALSKKAREVVSAWDKYLDLWLGGCREAK